MSSKGVPGGMPPSGSPSAVVPRTRRNLPLALGSAGGDRATRTRRGAHARAGGRPPTRRHGHPAARRGRAPRGAAGQAQSGGAVDRREGQGETALRAAALRELEEEAGVRLDSPDALVPFSRWITPPQVRVRFDTWFFLAPVPDGAVARADGSEVVEARWYAPSSALSAYSRGELLLVFPTIKHLEQLAGFASAEELLGHARGRRIEPVQP